ncbi:VCBS repeat-containing protein [Lacihabitans sp. LS3-19]|uniref:VCBS repeat-containing protein n=1 Tax=Lacihabitans sp. LS3-19 TaxID=2487335 RepID=UPI0020CC5727|nr:VCBS repeat-containing protein [Lacihabitans sp. LS3-19]
MFDQIPDNLSNVYFNNMISENEKYNVFDYHNLYNGGGVGVLDINNDGLMDLYFTGNQVSDKLYLNKGNFVFEDITESSGVESIDWSTGVSIVDINSDGLVDIYVCKSGNESADKRANHFYINEGNLKFHDEALERGLADTSYSNQAAFFDFDHDGDLDMYLLTTSNLIRNPNLLHKIDLYEDYAYDKLFENNGNGYFKEVGREKGKLKNTHGLGLAVGDLNNDGWEDILASSDFLPNDALYINNKNKAFIEKSSSVLPFQSRFSMGNDIADLNNDGLSEIITTDMLPSNNEQQKKMLMTSYHVFETEKTLGYDSEFTRNMLFKNFGTDNYGQIQMGEVGQFAGINATDWSWSPLMVDFDNDGKKDIVITNGYLRDVTDADYVSYNMSFAGKVSSESDMKKYMNYNSKNLPHLDKKNQFFKNVGNWSFENMSESWLVQKTSFSNGAAFVDLDNDGDMDYVVNNINESASIFRNNCKSNYLKIVLNGSLNNRFGQGAKVEVYNKGIVQTHFQTLSRGYLSSVDPSIIFGLEKELNIEKLIVTWSGGKKQIFENIKANQVLEVFEKDAVFEKEIEKIKYRPLFSSVAFTYSHKESRFIDYYRENLLLRKYSQQGPTIGVADVNNDGLEDVFIGGSSIQPASFRIQSQSAGFKEGFLLPNQSGEDSDCLFFDANNDDFEDLYVVAGSNEFPENTKFYQDQLWINDKKGHFINKTLDLLPEMISPGSVIVKFDIDHDGDLDLFRGGYVKPGKFPESSESFMLINTKHGFEKIGLGSIGIIKDAVAVDFNKDGWEDLVIVGEFLEPIFYENRKGTLNRLPAINKIKGLWSCIESADLDNDGDIDFVLGNIGKNYRYKFDKDHPLEIHLGEYSGIKQSIPTYYLNNVKCLIPTRDDLIRQIPTLRGIFPNYISYAQSKTDWISPQSEVFRAELMESIILKNIDGKIFEVEKLPNEVQMNSVKDFLIFDFNKDGFKDILIGGNDYDLEPTNSGFMEGNKGLLLEGTSKGKFQVLENQKSGFWINGAFRHFKMINEKSSPLVLAAFNNSEFKVFKLNSN